MEEFSVQNTHEALKNKLLDYITTAYFGKNDDLREMCIDEIKKKGVLWQEPYIEANTAYKSINNGISNSNLPEDVKEILASLVDYKLGVFPSPYQHQIEAIESFYKGNDLLVATGTGSGKTECFMWPMVTKLIREAKNTPKTWSMHGVRAIMLYPMNALVTDQIGRLRKMIGDSKGDFHQLFDQICDEDNRYPTFGMYTGRTPYPGNQTLSKDSDLADTLERDLVNKSSEIQEQLFSLGKFPSKHNLKHYIEELRNGRHVTDFFDAEMITRLEMQKESPDILITNYSMLEYMLMRTVEQNIWKQTKEWLNSSTENKLLFIIDEAHMYKGASGGEVALLIRRFLNKLNIDRSKVQFILTTASMPSNSTETINQFFCDLTAANNANNLKYITGVKDELNLNKMIEPNPLLLSSFDISTLHKPTPEKLKAVKQFAELANLDYKACSFDNEKDVENWLYTNLSHFGPLLRIMKTCRGNATSFSQLSKEAFPNQSIETAKQATSVVLAMAPFAKNKNGQVLFPSRLHMLFRGLSGMYACSNPNCTEKHINNNLPIGKIYFGVHDDICKCGGRIYELINDRACGALFYKGYMDEDDSEQYIWNKKSIDNESFKEVHFYIIPKNINYIPRGKSKIQTVWLNSLTGRIETNDNHASQKHYINLAYSQEPSKDNPNILTFKSCPKCKKTHLSLTDFSVKGNEPFYNIVSEQLHVQPQTIFDKNKLENNPNGGRKVLLFSDSRQKAAKLAKELTEISDEDALRTAIVISAKILEEWAVKNDEEATMNLLYTVFLQVASENNLRFFYGQTEEKLAKDIKAFIENKVRKEQRAQRRGKKYELDYDKLRKELFSQTPDLFSKYLLKDLCSNFRSLSDLGLCWVEPLESVFDDKYDELTEDDKVDIDYEDFKNLCISWFTDELTDNFAYDPNITFATRKSISKYPRFGIEADEKMASKYKKILLDHKLSESDIDKIYNVMKSFTVQNNSDTYFLNPELITLKYGVDSTWYKCPICGKIRPATLWGKCGSCGEGTPIKMSDKDFETLDFWRKPILNTLSNSNYDSMVRINTEEHTAQLSHKDQKMNTWSTTEEYEMRFQNIDIEQKGPVDILSCTTTMEVGIDIGSLTAVGLRNIPPMRENYQQRAGRAGRRSSAISTIVTYTDNGPHDSYYFYHPEKIISGEPSSPGIDIKNDKLIIRHISVCVLTNYLLNNGTDANELGIITFINDYLNDFVVYLSKWNPTSSEIDILIPKDKQCFIEEYKSQLEQQLIDLKNKVNSFKENYYKENDYGNKEEKNTLDILLEEGIFPTYSFPRNVVGFQIEGEYGKKLIQQPDRSLDIAISEYAPGKVLVIDKKTYKSGGIYSFHSKFSSEYADNPARPYFDSKDYYKPIYYCANKSCNWVSTEEPQNGICPFCGESNIKQQNLLKPWGFGPVNGTNINDAGADAEISYAEEPCYSTPIKDEDMIKFPKYNSLRYGRLTNQTLLIMNQGPAGKGFTICGDCGAAVPGDNPKELNKIKQPYTYPYGRGKECKHSGRVYNTFLGHQFLTDMVLFEIKMDEKLINCDLNGLWIDSAALSLSEAVALAATQLLDIDFNDIKSGYRIRQTQNQVYIDIYLFDSLSSGAGYSSLLTDKIEKLLNLTRDILHCHNHCVTACHDCLEHYWNQKVHSKLNRHFALQLLDWIQSNKLAKAIDFDKQVSMIKGLKELCFTDNKFEISISNDEILIKSNNKVKELIIYPSMWNITDMNNSKIYISESLLIKDLPSVYKKITNLML